MFNVLTHIREYPNYIVLGESLGFPKDLKDRFMNEVMEECAEEYAPLDVMRACQAWDWAKGNNPAFNNLIAKAWLLAKQAYEMNIHTLMWVD